LAARRIACSIESRLAFIPREEKRMCDSCRLPALVAYAARRFPENIALIHGQDSRFHTKLRSNHRDTPENDRKLDTSGLRINGLLSATWHQESGIGDR
jgi:hypothetical protein